VLYQILKAYARLTIHLYCTRIVVNKKELLKIKGPVLFAANHPNSFLDGIILSTLLDQDLYSLTRGDVFKNKGITKILRWLKLLPVYRNTEGTHKLAHNYTTFEVCKEIFRKKEIVLIFSEAGSINEWHLRPLRKGTARLAFASWLQGIELKVIPLAFNYSSFKKFGKEVHLDFGEEIKKESFVEEDSDGVQHNRFMQQLDGQLNTLVYKAKDEKDAKCFFVGQRNLLGVTLLFIPGIFGWIIHAPFFYLCRILTEIRFKKSDHYDGVLTGLLLLGYPFYILLFTLICFSYFSFVALSIPFLLPMIAWCWLQIKHLFE
jgi:1-acyl-sn-glycerol-3-phosphate acyltransferase